MSFGSFILCYSFLYIYFLICVLFSKVKMVLSDQKSDQKNAVTVANHSDQAITSLST